MNAKQKLTHQVSYCRQRSQICSEEFISFSERWLCPEQARTCLSPPIQPFLFCKANPRIRAVTIRLSRGSCRNRIGGSFPHENICIDLIGVHFDFLKLLLWFFNHNNITVSLWVSFSATGLAFGRLRCCFETKRRKITIRDWERILISGSF